MKATMKLTVYISGDYDTAWAEIVNALLRLLDDGIVEDWDVEET